MSSKPQFTQGQPELPLCSLKTALLVLLCANVLLGVVSLLTANDLPGLKRAVFNHAVWINPLILLLMPTLCAMQRKGWLGSFAAHEQDAPALEEAQLIHLGAAIRPHFFFNALNAVMGLIRVNPKQAEAVLQDTAELFRSVMEQHTNRLVALRVELETCEQYARIEQARLGQRLQMVWRIDRAVLGVSVPPFCLQPLIENAIRHGIEPMAQGGKVQVSIERIDEQLLLRVNNPVLSDLCRYQQVQRIQTADHNGVALGNIAARLQLMYAQAAQFDHGLVNGAYEAQITLPLEFAQ